MEKQDPKLMDQVRYYLRLHHYAYSTENIIPNFHEGSVTSWPFKSKIVCRDEGHYSENPIFEIFVFFRGEF